MESSMAARSALPPVVQESTPALIARILREAIADGRFPPGSQLVEQELARELNVSRGPLREAMQRLTQEGLVGHRNRGLFVMELTEDAVRDMYLAREAVECAAVRRIVATGTGPRAAEALAVPLAEMRAAAPEPNGRAMSEADLHFHELLVELAGSPRLLGMHRTLLTQIRMSLTGMQGTYGSADARLREHAEIAEALDAQDADRADTLLRAHMQDGLERVLGA
jgi:DNA-binding GntR family transcriptional regulator